MFGKRTRLLEAVALDHHARLMAIEVLLPFALAGRIPTQSELIEALEHHPDMKHAAIGETARQAARLVVRAEQLARR